jgi:hypothetical protein
LVSNGLFFLLLTLALTKTTRIELNQSDPTDHQPFGELRMAAVMLCTLVLSIFVHPVVAGNVPTLPGPSMKCFNNKEWNMLFQVGSTIHNISFTLPDAEFSLDGITHPPVPTSKSDINEWISVSSSILSSLGVSEQKAFISLAAQLASFGDARREFIRSACRVHFSEHGGLGILGYEDAQKLKNDPCCNEVQEELMEFYMANSKPQDLRYL